MVFVWIVSHLQPCFCHVCACSSPPSTLFLAQSSTCFKNHHCHCQPLPPFFYGSGCFSISQTVAFSWRHQSFLPGPVITFTIRWLNREVTPKCTSIGQWYQTDPSTRPKPTSLGLAPRYLQIRFSAKSRISVERIVSGRGVEGRIPETWIMDGSVCSCFLAVRRRCEDGEQEDSQTIQTQT